MQFIRKAQRAASILPALFVLCAICAQAVFGAASSNFEQEWSKLIAAAKQEGTLAVASGGAPSRQYRPVMDAFTKKFGVKVEVSTGNATDTVNRVLAERKAGKYTVDVALISVRENQQRLVPSESVVPFAPLLIHPEVVNTLSGTAASIGTATRNPSTCLFTMPR